MILSISINKQNNLMWLYILICLNVWGFIFFVRCECLFKLLIIPTEFTSADENKYGNAIH
jgi:hypothetical protein